MRLSAFICLALGLFAACKTTRATVQATNSADSIENEDQLPACDDITVGRVYWVRSLDMQMLCAEGGTWKPRQVDPDSKEESTAGSRGL